MFVMTPCMGASNTLDGRIVPFARESGLLKSKEKSVMEKQKRKRDYFKDEIFPDGNMKSFPFLRIQTDDALGLNTNPESAENCRER